VDHRDYEDYVSDVVRRIRLVKGSRVQQRVVLPGVRQPGEYEIDIAVEFQLGEALAFRVIIECKNWSRPVDRPVIQKLIQTREAVCAHKAVVVSPLGFTTEAIAVAKAHGIALWVVAEAIEIPLMGLNEEARDQFMRGLFRELQTSFAEHFVAADRVSHEVIVNATAAELDLDDSYRRHRRSGRGSDHLGHEGYRVDRLLQPRVALTPFVAPNLARRAGRSPVLVDLAHEFVAFSAAQASAEALDELAWGTEWVHSVVSRLNSLEVPVDRATRAATAVASHDWSTFSAALVNHIVVPAAAPERSGYAGRVDLRRRPVAQAPQVLVQPMSAASCPYCGEALRTSLAKQCRFCKRDWHDPMKLSVLSPIRW
jgi:hypothetical protein